MKKRKWLIIAPLLIIAALISLASVNEAEAAQVTLQWDPNNPAPEGYELYCRLAGKSFDYENPVWPKVGDDPTQTTATVSGLADDTTYYFVVRAYVGSDMSGDSNEVMHHTGTESSVDTDGDDHADHVDAFPDDPTEWYDSDGDGVGDNGDAFPLDPLEQYDTDSDGIGDNSDLFPEEASDYLDSDGDGLGNNFEASIGTNPGDPDTDGDGLDDGEEYELFGDEWNSDVNNDGKIAILDIDSDGDLFHDGEEFYAGYDPLNGQDVPIPSEPQDFIYVNNVLTWSSVHGADSYVVRYGTSPDNLSGTISANRSTAVAVIFPPGYYFAVEAVNKAGQSGPRSVILDNNPAPEPPGQVQNLVYVNNVLSWDQVNGASIYYLKYGTSPDNLSQTVQFGNVLSKAVDFPPGYYMAVYASNDYGDGPLSEVISSTPDLPSLIAVEGVEYVNGVLSWQRQASASGYRIYYSTNPDSITSFYDLNNNVESWAIGAPAGYYFQVSALRDSEVGPRSAVVASN